MPDLQSLVIDAAAGKKAEDIVTIPLEGRSTMADAFVICTGRSNVQNRAIADAMEEAAREAGFPPGRMEGYADGSWILLDLGNVIVHVFTQEQREFYNLERLWGKARPQGLHESQA